MAEQDDTPTEQPQPITGVATLESVGLALCTVGAGLLAGAEVHRGRSHAEQEVFLRAAADRLRNLRHFCTEAEQLLTSIAGYGSGRDVRALPVRRPSWAKRIAIVTGLLAALTALANALKGIKP